MCSASTHVRFTPEILDHFVGGGEQRRRHCDAERLGAVFRLITSLYLVALVGGLSRHIDPQACRLKSDPASVDAPWQIATRLIDAPVPGSWNA